MHQLTILIKVDFGDNMDNITPVLSLKDAENTNSSFTHTYFQVIQDIKGENFSLISIHAREKSQQGSSHFLEGNNLTSTQRSISTTEHIRVNNYYRF